MPENLCQRFYAKKFIAECIPTIHSRSCLTPLLSRAIHSIRLNSNIAPPVTGNIIATKTHNKMNTFSALEIAACTIEACAIGAASLLEKPEAAEV